MSEKKRISVYIDKKLFKKIKHKCTDEEIFVSSYLSNLADLDLSFKL